MKIGNQIKLKGKLKSYMQWPTYIGLLLVVMTIAAYCMDINAGIALSLFAVIYLIIYIVLIYNVRPSILSAIVDFSMGYSQIQKEMLKSFELPYAVLDREGRFMWTNKAFDVVLDDENVTGKYLHSVIPQIPKEVLPEGEGVNSIRVSYGERDFKVELRRLDITGLIDASEIFAEESDSYIISVFMFDETELNQCKQQIHDEQFAVGLVYIDNYDEALESVEEVRRSLLVGLVDRKINKYFGTLGGVVKKLEKDKYLVAFRFKSYEQLMEDKFSILEDVKAVSIGNELPITISIGIGAGEDTYLKCYEMCRSSMELALGRGGDQCVAKWYDGEKTEVKYYGGKSQSQEKNTRVKARVKAQALKEIISNKDKVIIMGHTLGDMDSFGASIGIYRAVKALGKRGYVVADKVMASVKPVRDKFKNNPDYEKDMIIDSAMALELLDANTVVVVVDVNSKTRTECPALIDRCRTKVIIDHHRQGSDLIEGAVLSYVEPYASSSCEMVAEILQYIKEGIKLKSLEADVLYAGMVVDTNSFSNRVGVRTFEAAAFIKRCGADTVRVRNILKNDLVDYAARAEAVNRVELFRDKYAITVCNTTGLQNDIVVVAKVANELLDVTGVSASFVMTYKDDVVYVSARSMGDLNVQIIMEKLGGGGHMNVAGCQIKNSSTDEVRRLIKNTITELEEANEL